MNAVITVVGKDRVGIIAGVCNALSEVNVNVLDISQTILGNMFTMNMLVDVGASSVGFREISNLLDQTGETLGVNIRIQLEEIFDAMHRI